MTSLSRLPAFSGKAREEKEPVEHEKNQSSRVGLR
jgi:hypothetical protein